jgi:LPS-assembly protein
MMPKRALMLAVVSSMALASAAADACHPADFSLMGGCLDARPAQRVDATPQPAAPMPVADADAVLPLEAIAGGADRSLLEGQGGWGYCAGGPRWTAPDGEAADSPLIRAESDLAEVSIPQRVARLTGDVAFSQGRRRVAAGQVRYDQGAEQLSFAGSSFFSDAQMAVFSQGGWLDLAQDRGALQQAEYRYRGQYDARGEAAEMRMLGRQRASFDDISYTTCPPGDNAWSLQAERLELDRADGEGVAYNARLSVAGVPLLYSPYLSFPIDDRRRSGWLTPLFGSSDETGFDITQPYYWNIAPQMDATLEPRWTSRRGMVLGGEFRYLTDLDHRGRLRGQYVPNDSVYDDGARGGASWQHQGALGRGWSTAINANYVSDDSYLENFGNSLAVTSTRNLERRADLRYDDGALMFLVRAQDFQTVDRTIAPVDRPYSRLPQLLLDYRRRLGALPLDLELDAEYAYFDHDHKTHGHRFGVHPALAMPLHRSYGHLVPRLSLNYVTYDLTGSRYDSRPDLLLPTFSLDAGLLFERQAEWFSQGLTQTLEPRLFYLYTPYEDQSGQPLFDTDQLDFSFLSLFRENRFSGRDRIGDANQLTLALTSRGYRSDDGRELFRASIGEIFHFADRRVQLGASPARHWDVSAGLIWDPQTDSGQTEKSALRLSYHSPDRRALNLAYRYNRGDLDTAFEDLDMSVQWPLGTRWEMVGRWYYSLRHRDTMEAFAGLAYNSCCWRVQGVVRHFRNSVEDDPNTAFMLQVELSGLGRFGDDLGAFLEQEILGYQD